MSDSELEELQNPDNWAFEHAEKGKRTRAPRAIVSVAFSREDFEKVGRCAEQLSMRTSEFIRDSAVARATRQIGLGSVSSFSSNATRAVFSDRVLSITRVGASSEGFGDISREKQGRAVTA